MVLCRDVHCMDTATGSLIRHLKVLGLWMLVRSEETPIWHGSLNLLASKIQSLRMTTLLHKKPDKSKKPEVVRPTSSSSSGIGTPNSDLVSTWTAQGAFVFGSTSNGGDDAVTSSRKKAHPSSAFSKPPSRESKFSPALDYTSGNDIEGVFTIKSIFTAGGDEGKVAGGVEYHFEVPAYNEKAFEGMASHSLLNLYPPVSSVLAAND